MYAALIRLTINPAQAPAAAAARGFISGYWLDPVQGEGFGFVLFETEEEARQATPPQSDWSAPGVDIGNVDVRRVAVALPSANNGLQDRAP
jgi:hypothetical protein